VPVEAESSKVRTHALKKCPKMQRAQLFSSFKFGTRDDREVLPRRTAEIGENHFQPTLRPIERLEAGNTLTTLSHTAKTERNNANLRLSTSEKSPAFSGGHQVRRFGPSRGEWIIFYVAAGGQVGATFPGLRRLHDPEMSCSRVQCTGFRVSNIHCAACC